LRALYISHTGMSEPLGRSQVIPYVLGLSRAGWQMDVVSFEPAAARTEDIDATRALLAAGGVGYRWSRRSLSHSTTVKLAEIGEGCLLALARALRGRPRIVHARSYLPAAVAGVVSALVPGARFLFDVRGLLAEEYVDAGHWTERSFQYRALKRVERRLFARADGVVVLTDRHRRWLIDEARLLDSRVPVEVVPCCVDMQRFTSTTEDRRQVRADLGAGDRLVLCYSGSLGSWYCEQEMARMFAAVCRRRPSLFAVFTRSPPEPLRAALTAEGVPPEAVRFLPVPPAQMPRFLSGCDAALSFIAPCFSKLGSSPTKVAEYLAMGLPVAMNRGIGDVDQLIDRGGPVVDAGHLAAADIEAAAEALVRIDRTRLAERARRMAEEHFSIETVGIPRYSRLYEAMAH
jgi:glycosyltransferase involved in cell wall biosynthesis